MIVLNRKNGYSSQRKYIQGRGFVDSLSSSLKGVGSYIAQNKDLIAKPLLGAAGELAAFGLTEAGKSLITHIINKKKSKVDPNLSPKSLEILQNLMAKEESSNQQPMPVSNIIGSGIKRF
jgi:hypothetical protein